MIESDILIKNGFVVNSETSYYADIAVKAGKILEIAKQISPGEKTKVIDAKGLYVIPGGIDPHVHLYLPTPAGYSADDFRTGSISAIYGATTSIIDFVTPGRGENLEEAFKKRKIEATNALIDYSFHVSPVDFHPGIESEIQRLVSEGITSFKVYLAYQSTVGIDIDTLKKVMAIVGKVGGIVTVHAESGDMVNRMREEFAAAGKLSCDYHFLSRPRSAEAEAVKDVIKCVEETGCKAYLVHISAKESVNLIREAQKKGISIFAETCPQYLMLNEKMVKGRFEHIAKYVFSPPVRRKKDNKSLWKALKKEIIQTVGTDHCPFTLEQKAFGKDDFRKIPNGVGGIEHRMSILYTYGVMTKKISLNQFVALTSSNIAKIFGMYPQKGVIAEGSDADIVVWDPSKEFVISKDMHHQKTDINIFEGINVFGCPRYVLSKGRIILNKNVLHLDACKAELMKRYTV